MFEKLCRKYLPFYFKFLPNYWIAIWCAPVRYSGTWKIDGEWVPVYRSDTAFEALRITIRKGEFASIPIITIKHGTI